MNRDDNPAGIDKRRDITRDECLVNGDHTRQYERFNTSLRRDTQDDLSSGSRQLRPAFNRSKIFEQPNIQKSNSTHIS